MKREHTIFFALPFDNLTISRYKSICEDLITLFDKKGYKLKTMIGKDQIGLSPEYSDILAFKAQNTELHKQFIKGITEADILVADLTNNNPNVHLELGIALTLNKNILRVTGRPVKELGFDIQSLEVYTYKDEKDLLNKIEEYLILFLKIKELDFSPEYKHLYKKPPTPLILPETEPEIGKEKLWTIPIPDFSFRDGAIKLDFEFLNTLNNDSWAGVYFRVAKQIHLGSYLLYIRKNGFVELAVINPWINNSQLSIIYKEQILNHGDLDKKIQLLIEIENNELEVQLNRKKVNIPKLSQQINGQILLANYECRSRFENIEIINRDSIDLFF